MALISILIIIIKEIFIQNSFAWGSSLSYLPGEWFSILVASLRLGNHWEESAGFRMISARVQSHRWATFSEESQHADTVSMEVVTNDLLTKTSYYEIWYDFISLCIKANPSLSHHHTVCDNVILIPIPRRFLEWDRKWWRSTDQAGNFFSLWACPRVFHMANAVCSVSWNRGEKSWGLLYTQRTKLPNEYLQEYKLGSSRELCSTYFQRAWLGAGY